MPGLSRLPPGGGQIAAQPPPQVIAAARLLFERAAEAGSADAALALGSTYDPLVIRRTADLDKARKWYQVAADRGSAAASLQLANLARGR